MNGLSKYSTIDHEPNRPVDRGDDEQAVGERHVVGHQQGASLGGHVRPADDPHAIDRVCQADHQESQKRLRDERERPEEAAPENERRSAECAAGADAALSQRQRQHRAEQHAAVDQGVRDREDRASAVRRRSPLNERVERNDQESAEEAQKASTTTVPKTPGPIRAKASVVIVSPSAPKGSRPYSTVAPEILPASRQPTPTPIPIAASGRLTCQSINPRWLAS